MLARVDGEQELVWSVEEESGVERGKERWLVVGKEVEVWKRVEADGLERCRG